MRFSCPSCGATFNIPDQAAIRARDLKFSCRKCGSVIELAAEALSRNSEFDEQPDPARPAGPEEMEEDAEPIGLRREGEKTSLICVQDPSMLEALCEMLRRMDYHVTRVRKPESVLDIIRLDSYDLLLMEGNHPHFVIQQIKTLPMPIRRRFFFCLLSEAASTSDRMFAFGAGADLILNVQDIDRADAVLSRGLKEQQASYRIFREELEKKGQL